VLDQASTSVTPIDMSTNTAKPPTDVGISNGQISGMLLAPDGSMAYVGRFAGSANGAPPALPGG